MNQSFLALKGVGADYRSAFVGSYKKFPYTIKYEVGKEIRRTSKRPMWLIDYYSPTGFALGTGCDNFIKRLLLVRVPRKHIVSHAVFCHPTCIKDKRLKEIEEFFQMLWQKGKYVRVIGATRLTVLEEIPIRKSTVWDNYIPPYYSIHEAMEAYEKKYGLPRITSNEAMLLNPC